MALERAGALGFGAMRLSTENLEASAALRLLHEAYDRGVRFFDTADVYAPDAKATGHNERLLARALGRREDVIIATKGGLRRQGKQWIPDGRAKHLKAACEASLRALDVEAIDLYQLHALDPKVPAETSFRALASLRERGKIRHIGLCNLRLHEIEIAREIVPIASVQAELSPLTLTPLKNGVVSYCVANGIRLIAHSPLGGHRRSKRLGKHPVLTTIAERHGVSAHEVALAWLRRIDPTLLPIPGAARIDSLVSSLHALDVTLTDDDLAELDEAFPAGSVVRSPRASVPTSADGEVALFVGYPGAGKSTLAETFVARGYVRLNRDRAGGRLSDLLPELDRLLASGARRVVLDNTYPRRESRFDVVEIARKHGVPVRCIWLATSLERAQVNAVRRMLDRYGRLLDPEELASIDDPNAFTPEAQFRYRRELEPPRVEEGFVDIERAPFTARDVARGSGKAIFIDTLEMSPERREALRRSSEDGYRLFAVIYAPGGSVIPEPDLPIEVLACTHPPGPAVCWCRKPLPGLGVLAIEKYGLDPAKCIAVGESPAHRGWASRLGIRSVAAVELFGSGDSG